MRRAGALALKALWAVCAGLATAWAALAAYWSDIANPMGRTALAAGVVLGACLIFASIRRRGVAALVFAGSLGLFILWWASIAPSNSRLWQPDVALLPGVEVNGDTATVRNIRNFAYRTETEYRPRYEDKTYDLRTLDSVDLIAVYWMGDAIAHVMVSFGFGGKDYLCLSIETRKEQGEEYSSLKGFFKQYELVYVAANERDLIRLRTDYRRPPEDVYIFRTRVTPENARKLFLEYASEMNRLRVRPEFYNTLTTNCTTDVVRHVRAFGGKARYNWKILLSGYAPQYAYELGGLDDSLPFGELRARSLVNGKAHAIGDAPDFSARIREGLPGVGPATSKE
jgi:Domain of unknown function (DUF4105)